MLMLYSMMNIGHWPMVSLSISILWYLNFGGGNILQRSFQSGSRKRTAVIPPFLRPPIVYAASHSFNNHTLGSSPECERIYFPENPLGKPTFRKCNKAVAGGAGVRTLFFISDRISERIFNSILNPIELDPGSKWVSDQIYRCWHI